MQFLIEKYDELNFDFKNQMADLTHAEFGHIPLIANTIWATPDYSLATLVDGQLTTFFHIVIREIFFYGKKVKTAGIQNLITPPQYRGRHYATLALNKGEKFIFDTLKSELALLLCTDSMTPFFQRLGWQKTNLPTFFSQEDSHHHEWQANTMILLPPFENDLEKIIKKNSANDKVAQIDLCGLPW